MVSTTEYTAVVTATPEASEITENSVNIGDAIEPGEGEPQTPRAELTRCRMRACRRPGATR